MLCGCSPRTKISGRGGSFFNCRLWGIFTGTSLIEVVHHNNYFVNLMLTNKSDAAEPPGEFTCETAQQDPQQTQNICITFLQCRTNVEGVGPTLYKCYTNILCLLGL